MRDTAMKNDPMHYVAVEWLHLTSNEPTRLYYELDSDRYECRKVEEYRDGTFHSANAAHGQGTTFLAWESHPPLAEIEAVPQFRAREINAQEFERVWARAREGALQPATSLAR